MIAPSSLHTQTILARKCSHDSRNESQFYFINSTGQGCNLIDDWSSPKGNQIETENSSIYFFQMPLPISGVHHPYSRWLNRMIGMLQVDIHYYDDWKIMPSKLQVVIESHLAFRSQTDSEDYWKGFASSVEQRNMECSAPTKKHYLHTCSLLPIFHLGSIHHDYYLLNLRFPKSGNKNQRLGPITDLFLITISQSEQFAKVWLSLKTVFFPLVIIILARFWRRIQLLAQQPNLIESLLISLGLSLSLHNLPLEYLTLWLDLPFMQLIVDAKQQIFFATLFSFWLVLAGEHFRCDPSRHIQDLATYKRTLYAIGVGCLSVLIFNVCEWSINVDNPFHFVWSTEVVLESRLEMGFIILCSTMVAFYWLFLAGSVSVTVYNIWTQQMNNVDATVTPSSLSEKELCRQSLTVMLATLLCATLTVIDMTLHQVSRLAWKRNWDVTALENASAFFTGVYGVWNFYVTALFFIYDARRQRERQSVEAKSEENDSGDEINEHSTFNHHV